MAEKLPEGIIPVNNIKGPCANSDFHFLDDKKNVIGEIDAKMVVIAKGPQSDVYRPMHFCDKKVEAVTYIQTHGGHERGSQYNIKDKDGKVV
jgi:hypothetical protein